MEFIKGHVHRPEHVHTDLFGRLTQATRVAMREAAEAAQTRVAEGATKEELNEIGDEILASYMKILGRPGAFVRRGFCDLADWVGLVQL